MTAREAHGALEESLLVRENRAAVAEPPYVLDELEGARVPGGGELRRGASADRGEWRGDIAVAQEEAQDNAETVDIGSLVDPFAARLFGRHIAGRSDHGPLGLLRLRGVELARDPPVHHESLAERSHHN